MAELVYVDNSNLFIEGKRVKAVASGMAKDIYAAMNNDILDNSYKIDFGKLHDFIAGDDSSQIKRCVLFGSRPPPNDSIWHMAEKAGFDAVIEDRNVANKEKRIDTGIVAIMMKDAYNIVNKEIDTITLVAGDGDFVPPVKILVGDGFTVDVVFWSHASRELTKTCTSFIDLDKHIDYLSH